LLESDAVTIHDNTKLDKAVNRALEVVQTPTRVSFVESRFSPGKN
jgi:hypothetical protein